MSVTTAAAARRAVPTRAIWAAALCLCALAAAEAVALAFATPLKTTRTAARLVDKRAGATAVILPGVSAALSPAVTRALLMQYLRARETFDDTDIRQNYARVIAWSAPGAANEYRRLMTRANPESPLAVYPTRTTVAPALKAITFLSDNTALIRFDLSRQDGGNRPAPPVPYTSVVSFGFVPKTNTDPALNPLGFRVTNYTRNADASGLALLSAAGK